MSVSRNTISPLSPHRQQKYDAMVQKILDTARQIMREQGVASLSMHEIARRMNLRAPSLYNYFGSKLEIYDALFRQGFTLFGKAVEQLAPPTGGLHEFLTSWFEHYLTFARENPELYQLCFERPVPGFVPSEASLQLSFGMLQQAYRQAAEIEQVRQAGMPPEQFVDLCISIMHGITAMHMANEPNLPPGQGRFGSLIPAAVDLLERALSPAGSGGGTHTEVL